MYLRLSLLQLLQWSIPGALVPLYSLRLKELGFSPVAIGVCCATQAVATVLSSMVAGQVADRWLSAEKAMSVCALLASVSLWLIGSAHGVTELFLLTLFFWVVTGPLLLLGTTITFANLARPDQQFGPVRMWGTVGWMAVAWVIGYWLARPDWLAAVRQWVPAPSLDDAPRLGALLALALAAYTWTLPHTPPRPRPGSDWLAPLQALRLLRDPAFASYLACFAGGCMTFPFVTQNAPLMLRQLGVSEARVGPMLSLAQLTEIFFLAALPLLMRHLGTRRTMGVGLAAWLLALGVLAAGGPTWLVVASLGLHGLYVTGFVIAGQVYANGLADDDLRASVQGLCTTVNGVGLLAGNLLAAWLRQWYGDDLPATFLVAAGIVTVCCVMFVVGFRQPAVRA